MPADAQAIVDKLKTANVSYSLSDNGTTISVPRDRIAELRLRWPEPAFYPEATLASIYLIAAAYGQRTSRRK
ncbi:MAG: hypothetical protein WKF84_01120 [Pyrinomonadaceae bacterium]